MLIPLIGGKMYEYMFALDRRLKLATNVAIASSAKTGQRGFTLSKVAAGLLHIPCDLSC